MRAKRAMILGARFIEREHLNVNGLHKIEANYSTAGSEYEKVFYVHFLMLHLKFNRFQFYNNLLIFSLITIYSFSFTTSMISFCQLIQQL